MEKFENFITVRLLMQGKEVGSIIGKKGDNIKQIREQSGARITISDGSTPERIVTINGQVENVNKAFAMICKKFEDDLMQTCNANSIPPITLRLIVPASQCGSIIGKGGSKIKEIRELTGASIQVASEMLPGSTERAVTVSGKLDSIIECFKQVSAIMLESPPKGDTLSYKPRQVQSTPQTNTPIIFAHGQAYSVQGQFAVPLPPHEVAKLIQMGAFSQVQPQGPMPAFYYPEDETATAYAQTPQPIAPHPQQAPQPQVNLQSVSQAAPAAQPRSIHSVQTHEMNIPNDLIGCIIGRGGQKISEIRLVSGANIKIADLEDGNPDRHVSMTGTPEQIQLAQFLINASTNMLPNTAVPNSLASDTTATSATTTSPPSTNSTPAINTSFTQFLNKQPFMKTPTGLTQLEGLKNPTSFVPASNGTVLQPTQLDFQKSLYKNSESIPESSESSSNNDIESSNLNDSSSSSISTVENNENNSQQTRQSILHKQQAEIAMQLQQEMNKKNFEAQLMKKNTELTYQQRFQQQQQQQQQQSLTQSLMYQQTLLQANLFNLPLQHQQQQQPTQPLVSQAAYQTKINSFQSDESARQLKRSLIHFKPY